jgi:hypothetical protein
MSRLVQRCYVKIAVLRGRNATECHSELVEALGDRALPYRTVARWIEALRGKRFRTRKDAVRREMTRFGDGEAGRQRVLDTLGDYFEGC